MKLLKQIFAITVVAFVCSLGFNLFSPHGIGVFDNPWSKLNHGNKTYQNKNNYQLLEEQPVVFVEFDRACQFIENQEGVVLDARMPGLDGFWLADQISEVYPSLKIVILSAHSYPLQSDQYTFLTKPVHIPDLIEVLEQDVSLIEKRETA